MPSADRLETIAHARQVLLHERSTSVAPTLAPWLQRGWQRCQSWGLQPGQPVGFDPVSAARMRQVQEASQPLVQAARPVLAELVRAMGNIGYFAILTNASLPVIGQATAAGLIVPGRELMSVHLPLAFALRRRAPKAAAGSAPASGAVASVHSAVPWWGSARPRTTSGVRAHT